MATGGHDRMTRLTCDFMVDRTETPWLSMSVLGIGWGLGSLGKRRRRPHSRPRMPAAAGRRKGAAAPLRDGPAAHPSPDPLQPQGAGCAGAARGVDELRSAVDRDRRPGGPGREWAGAGQRGVRVQARQTSWAWSSVRRPTAQHPPDYQRQGQSVMPDRVTRTPSPGVGGR
jgi:hypothetical protein